MAKKSPLTHELLSLGLLISEVAWESEDFVFHQQSSIFPMLFPRRDVTCSEEALQAATKPEVTVPYQR